MFSLMLASRPVVVMVAWWLDKVSSVKKKDRGEGEGVES